MNGMNGFVIEDSVPVKYAGPGGDVTVPEGVTAVGAFAFAFCGGLIGVRLPEGLVSIGDSAFSGCRSLTGLALPGSVVSVGENAFDGRTGLNRHIRPRGESAQGQG